MKIKRISCTQFAGIRNKSISLNDGINVIYGKNESGKTTIVNILSRTLFQDAKIDKRTNKDFCALYFPSDKKDGHIRGDYADGEIAFETDSGEYVLSKEWGGNPYCRLSTPSGAVRDANRINEILKTELAYGEGVYNDIILQSHKNSDAALMSLLDAAGKTDSKRELTDAVTTAFAQSDGVSVDAIGGAIEKKINEIAGAHWDFEKNIPAVNKKGRWSKGIGEIHKAYYSMEDAHETQKRIFGLEAAADEAAADYEEKEKLYREASAAAERFGEFVNRLEVRSERLKSIKRLESELKTCTEALEELPRLKKQLISARALQTEKSNRDILNKYAEAKKLKDRAAELADRLKKAVCPSSREIADAKFAAKEIEKLENKLRGMNIFAKIKMLGAHEARVELLRTGEIVDISNGGAPIDEAVKITIPEVMEMELTPADTDAAAINREIAEKKAAAAAICGKYAAEDAERLEAMADEYKILDNEAKNAAARLDMYLGDEIFENLEAVAGQISGEIRESGEIERDAAALCGRTELAGFIAGHEALIKKSEETYGGEEALAARAESIRADIEAAKEAVDKQDDIPKEYLKIQDPDRHRTALKRAADELRNERDDALKKKTAAERDIENQMEEIGGDPSANAAAAERVFEEYSALLSSWLHINKVFSEKKNELTGNPMHDIAERFAGYLDIISGGRVSSEFPVQDRLEINIYSGDNLIDYGKLSEGTKETVSLAFRLAALDHLFPSGGVAVFDDPLTEMDEERAARSCRLLTEFAKRHQVIFLTCREEYIGMLKGNAVYIDNE